MDLSNVKKVHHAELIRRHKKDIEEYKKYQDTLDPELRYDSTIGKIKSDKIKYDNIRDNKIKKALEEENTRFRMLLEKFIT